MAILSEAPEQSGDSLDRDVPEKLMNLSRPHIESYDYFIAKGMHEAVERLDHMEITHPVSKKMLEMWVDNLVVHQPAKEYTGASESRLFPNECREGGLTYRGKLTADICYRVGDGPVQKFDQKTIGSVPIMVRSSRCHLQHLTQRELVARHEEALEFGGYFIVNGIEKLIRMLIVPRRNYIMALKRSAYLNRGPMYSDKATVIRCACPDQTTMTTRLHYLVDGNANVAFTLRRQEFFIPVGIVLKSLVEASDKEIYERLIAGGGSHFVAQRAELVLREVHRYTLRTRAECLAFLGERFRALLDYPARLSDRAAGQKLLDDNVLVHLERPQDKFNLLVFMVHKLYALVDGGCCDDNADALVHHELLLPGHLLTMFLKERLQEYLQRTKAVIEKDLRENRAKVDFGDAGYLKKALDKNGVDLGKKLGYFLATGNLVSQSGLDLQQASGFTIVAERLNYLRYVSHFRSVHRGAYFAQLRTTTVRKLLPESWGFMCPVHTPDGAPCGLLMHLTMHCRVVTADRTREADAITAKLNNTLLEMGMLPAATGLVLPSPPSHVAVLQDGRVIGALRASAAPGVVARMRALKTQGELPADLEIAHIPFEEGGPFPGVFLATSPARMIRPVRQLDSGKVEMIGPLEQMYMDVRCPDGVGGGGADVRFTHEELHPTAMLSMVANLTPWSDYNQSPRNMYQCQMGKQTMGVPYHANTHRPDTKTYRLQTPQRPIARTGTYGDYCVDDYPLGTNAVVAVLAYTGYDMEDAMIINKSAMERGLCHGTMFKTETIDLRPLRARGDAITTEFRRGAKKARPAGPGKSGDPLEKFIDVDGLPHVGQPLRSDDPYVSAVNRVTGQEKLTKLKGSENAVVDQVTLLGGAADEPAQAVSVKLRYNRNPVIGDKFSSRHGQKGVLSQLWPDVDMPFAANTGMRPDIIINPHAFPSRMTIGMLVESMAAKAGALRGEFVDATPFRSSTDRQDKSIVDQFGEQLAAAGFNYYGNETMYSGVLGTELTAQIYMGVVYYQRLRHMVSDKFQVRSVGPVNNLTHQPVKGRKAGGGIRFGEMERDSLLAHGAAFLLHDRLHASSDYHTTDVCSTCGSLLSTQIVVGGVNGHPGGPRGPGEKRKVECRVCGTSRGVERVAMPYVFKFLAAELAAMNIKVKLTLSK